MKTYGLVGQNAAPLHSCFKSWIWKGETCTPFFVWTSGFTRAARKFLKPHPDLREKFVASLDELQRDPLQPYRRYHHLDSKPKGVQAISITSSNRFTLTLLVSDLEINLV